jgi:Ca-activated chloride channel family protein
MEVTKSNKLDMIIFLTDGSVGNEHEIIRAVDKYLGKTRLFSVGIGSAPNSYVLEEASKRGRGTFTYIGDLSQVSAKMSELFSKIESPVITDMRLDLSAKTETYPNPLPDLFKNEPVIVFGKIEDKGDQSAILTGRINNEVVSLDIPIFFSSGVKNPAISTLWARAKIKNKMNDFILGNAASKKEIIDLAIDFNIMSKFTSFVAVEQKIVNPSGKSLASALPTELPDGWNFDKVFGKNSPITLTALPQTATNKPFYLLIGLLLISLSVLVRFTRANSI